LTLFSQYYQLALTAALCSFGRHRHSTLPVIAYEQFGSEFQSL
jgi:hypothetical protein